jgi:hypothetical protein
MEFVPLECIKQEPEEEEESIQTDELDIKPDPIEEFTIPTSHSETLDEGLLAPEDIKLEDIQQEENNTITESRKEDASQPDEDFDTEIAFEVEEELGSELEKEDSDSHDIQEQNENSSMFNNEPGEFVIQDNEKNGEFVIVQDSEEESSNSDWKNAEKDMDEESDNEQEFSGHFLAPVSIIVNTHCILLVWRTVVCC